MYLVVYRNDGSVSRGVSLERSDTIVCKALTLEEAKAYRQVSGDLVTTLDHKVVTDFNWLWDWERSDPTSYAHQQILKA